MDNYDIILRNLTIYDGQGSLPYEGDIAVKAGRIEATVSVTGTATHDLDLTGFAVSPGFIDVHTHDDFAAVLHPDMGFKLQGGVTTCIVGNCGFGAAPWPEASILAKAFHPRGILPRWDGYEGYLKHLDQYPPGTNIAMLVGHGTVRMAAMQRANREPSGEELRLMKSLISEGLEAGAYGFSTGLVYEPGKYARTEEIIELAKTMTGTGALYATHMRDEGPYLLESIDEALAIGQAADTPVQISHHKASGESSWGKVSESLKKIELAQAQGMNVHADQYPYTAGSTILSSVITNGAFVKDRNDRENIAPANIVIAATAGHPEWEGKSIADLMVEFRLDAHAAAARILSLEPGATVIMHTMSEDDVRLVMQHASTMIGSDGIPTLEGKPHPRLYNTFARVLGHYARDLQLLTIQQAIFKMTGFAARKFGLKDRGEIRVGAWADLVVFDQDAIIDLGTFAEPNRYPAGIKSVYVNGELAVSEGVLSPTTYGSTLRRTDKYGL